MHYFQRVIHPNLIKINNIHSCPLLQLFDEIF